MPWKGPGQLIKPVLPLRVMPEGGGVPLAKDAFTIVSREVLQVRLPDKALTTTAEDGKTYVEVHVATPNGISNRLLVPVAEEPAQRCRDFGQLPFARLFATPIPAQIIEVVDVGNVHFPAHRCEGPE